MNALFDALSFGRTIRVLATTALLAVTACGGGDVQYQYPEKTGGGKSTGSTYDSDPSTKKYTGSIFGADGLFGGGKKEEEGGGGGIGVNSFLWRASLDSIAFMPLASADPFGGVIITDWYSPPETPNERFKCNIYILGRQLRADGIKAAVFRQKRDGDAAGWTDVAVESRTALDLENVILSRARQLRLDSQRP